MDVSKKMVLGKLFLKDLAANFTLRKTKNVLFCATTILIHGWFPFMEHAKELSRLLAHGI